MMTGFRIAAVLSTLLLAPGLASNAFAGDPAVADRVTKLTRGTAWKQVAAIPIAFPTFHPQGMVRIGDDFFVSSVNIIKPTTKYPALREGYDRDTGEGEGHLFRVSKDGKLLADLKLGEGSVYHPGGIDFDGKFIWVPVAEYRPNSQSIIYKVDPATMKAVEVFRFKDHVGGIVHDTERNSLHGVSWGSRRFYAWPLGADGKIINADIPAEKLRVMNPAQYIDYQDCHYAGGSRMLCSGLNAYKVTPDAAPFRLGGLELVDLKDNRPVWQVPVELWAPSGLPMTQNPAFVEANKGGLRAYFMPDDDKSTLFVYEAQTP
ncbi:DUF6454 family protein [Labrys sedimenti]|uniref:DUF6454 family protein n=1 Tax=Labrys sedimenti TaxID=3106036 RepID=UPI002ACA1BB9|nr:DUF6454 family protein [Labrys sp. ZIDIC5]MDZ5452904.1 DUF6454 family protein [Labrys sp. ZIDIC5]